MTEQDPTRRVPLTRETVLREAVALADESGTAALSMRGLARRLGIEAMSLYHHVANKDAILDGMVDAVFAEVEAPAIDGDWRSAIRARCSSLRHVLVRHPWAVGLLESRTSPGPETLRHHDRVLGCLRRAGFTIAGAGHAYALLDSYVYGFALQENAVPFDPSGQTPEELAALATAIMADFPRDELPSMAEMTAYALRPGYAFADEFEVGLDVVLDGLDAHRATW
ncbi:regulatory TetR family protein [Mumia flava]|uniref:Regulatory TetR family protein n=1 Tax=Mumia flava TaxID=1348852 RepID=A0A0B2BGQ9_9ACTN|nr:TetR/AcrR family transcriptional regulator [Mumia flava]PJJ56414.1 regulatory TetR family protein [Mumia flava]